MLLEAGVKTNIHYVLGKNSIVEAITRLKEHTFPKGINAVIFLLHKPAGLGTQENVLSPADPQVAKIFGEISAGKHPHKVGMDSCCVPGLINFGSSVIYEALNTCEGARHSCYISADMKLLLCSFDQNGKYAVSLRNHTIAEAWNSEEFEAFRKPLRNRCPDCKERANCMGGCPLMPGIVLCKKESQTF